MLTYLPFPSQLYLEPDQIEPEATVKSWRALLFCAVVSSLFFSARPHPPRALCAFSLVAGGAQTCDLLAGRILTETLAFLSSFSFEQFSTRFFVPYDTIPPTGDRAFAASRADQGMGFDRPAVLQALQQTGNDSYAAVNVLVARAGGGGGAVEGRER